MPGIFLSALISGQMLQLAVFIDVIFFILTTYEDNDITSGHNILLLFVVSIIQMIIKNMERDKYTSIIHEELNKLGLEFSRYKERWDKLSRSIQAVNKDVESVSITTEKITKKFETINKVDVVAMEDDTEIKDNTIDTITAIK